MLSHPGRATGVRPRAVSHRRHRGRSWPDRSRPATARRSVPSRRPRCRLPRLPRRSRRRPRGRHRPVCRAPSRPRTRAHCRTAWAAAPVRAPDVPRSAARHARDGSHVRPGPASPPSPTHRGARAGAVEVRSVRVTGRPRPSNCCPASRPGSARPNRPTGPRGSRGCRPPTTARSQRRATPARCPPAAPRAARSCRSAPRATERAVAPRPWPSRSARATRQGTTSESQGRRAGRAPAPRSPPRSARRRSPVRRRRPAAARGAAAGACVGHRGLDGGEKRGHGPCRFNEPAGRQETGRQLPSPDVIRQSPGPPRFPGVSPRCFLPRSHGVSHRVSRRARFPASTGNGKPIDTACGLPHVGRAGTTGPAETPGEAPTMNDPAATVSSSLRARSPRRR